MSKIISDVIDAEYAKKYYKKVAIIVTNWLPAIDKERGKGWSKANITAKRIHEVVMLMLGEKPSVERVIDELEKRLRSMRNE